MVLVVFQKTFGPVGIGVGDGGTHRFQADPVMVELHGVELDPYRRLRAAANIDITDPFQLR